MLLGWSAMQQSVSSMRRMAMCMLKEFEKVNGFELPHPQASLKTGLETRLGFEHGHSLSLLRYPLVLSLVLTDLAMDFTG